jgi:hypothetical protein
VPAFCEIFLATLRHAPSLLLKMETEISFETLLSVSQTTRRHISEYSSLSIRRHRIPGFRREKLAPVRKRRREMWSSRGSTAPRLPH